MKKVNTELGVDLKSVLNSDARIMPGKKYIGIICLDNPTETIFGMDAHFTFVEVAPSLMCVKRNPHVFVGQYITITRRDDGTLCLHFKALPRGKCFSVGKYAKGVGEEIKRGLDSLVEKGVRHESNHHEA